MTTVTDGYYQYGGMPVGADLLAVGNVYYVCQTGNTTVHADMVQRFKGNKYKNDHSNILHSTIATALTATVANRNDYILIVPDSSDHDLTATLTMSKKAVHLLCPAAMGMTVGANNCCRIEQTGNYAIITVSGQAVEIAGLYFKNKATYAGITFGTDTWAPHVHHNTFNLSLSGATNSGSIIQTTTNTNSMGYGLIERNEVHTGNSGSLTVQSIIDIGGPATCARVGHNEITIGDGVTCTVAISNVAYKGQTYNNKVIQAAASGGSSAGTITTGISISAGGSAMDNRISISDPSAAIAGGNATNCVNNICSLNGGTITQ